MGLSVNDIVSATKIIFDEMIHHYDPLVAPSPWRDQDFLSVLNKKSALKIGIFGEFNRMPCSRASRRAVTISAEAL